MLELIQEMVGKFEIVKIAAERTISFFMTRMPVKFIVVHRVRMVYLS